MEIKASLDNLRMAPRKVRLVANLVKGLRVAQAKGQLAFMIKKPAPLILKLLNSAAANAKSNFNIEENNLYIAAIFVECGPTLKRWMSRAMGRATPIRKRTCSVKIVLKELVPGAGKLQKAKKPRISKAEETLPAEIERKPELIAAKPEPAAKIKPIPQVKPFGASSQSKKRYFSRQTFGNIRKMFRRKSI